MPSINVVSPSYLEVTDDEREVLEKYRRAKEIVHSRMEVTLVTHVQNSVLVHINVTEKYSPVIAGARRTREG